MVVPVRLRKNETLAQVAAGFGVSTATVGRAHCGAGATVPLLRARPSRQHESDQPTVAAVHAIEIAWRSG
ncbi:hypothetical protein ACR9VJ_35570 [Streptomyces sp. H49]|uniref:hypothetical protein n=1 Tax=Streptomyces sp. H49 TaxID=3444117 RepID=UPI003F4AC17B